MGHRHAPPLLLLAALALAGCDAAPPLQPGIPGSAPTNFTLSGTVTGGDLPVAGVRITGGGRSAQTDELGRYSITGLSGLVRVSAEKADYEPEAVYASMVSDQVRDFSLKQTIRIRAGEIATITMLSDDRAYSLPTGYSECPAPCKAIRVFAPAGAPVPVWITLRPRDQSRRLQVYVEDGMRDYCCVAEQELFYVLVGGTDEIFHIRFRDTAGSNADPRIDIATSLHPR